MSKSALTRADKKAIREAIARANRTDRREKSAQDSIPFLQMWPDGICRTTDKHYTKTVQFQDINYQLCKPDDKDTIFGGWAGFLNYFDSSIDFSLSFLNRSMSANGLEAGIFIENTGDAFDAVRDEYNSVLEAQLALGNNSIIKTKYLTFGLDAKSHKDAENKLKSIENAVLSNFKKLGVPAAPLSGKARLRLLHSIFHIGASQPFRFNWKWLVPSGLSVKDYVSPSSFEFKTGNSFRMGDTFGQANFLQIDAAELDDRVLADLLDVESDILVTLHIHAVDRNKAIKTVKRKITDLDRAKIEEQKKAVRSGYDMDIIPSDLATYGEDAKTLLRGLQKNDEHMFLVTPLIVTFAGNRQDLKNQALQLSSIAQRHNCSMVRLDFQQEEGLMSSLPLGNNLVDIQRGLTTSSTAIFVPFTTQELFQPTRRALYYGINALSNNMIMVDRQVLKNPNGLILGVPGSGKSFSAKREILNVFLACPEDDIIICDPEGEYTPLVTHLNGQVVKISPSGIGYDGKPCYVNPLDLNIGYDDGDPLTMKYQFMLSFFELIAGGRNGLQPTERTIIDRCVHLVYQKYLNDLRPENMPTLGDLYQILLEQEEKEARYLATALEIYVSGSLNVFNHQTTVDLKNRVVCYDIKDLGSHLKKIGMMIIQDQVWNRVSENRKRGKTTRYYVDEFHLLLADPETAAFSTEIWKRFRKWGGVPTGITQNVKDLLSSDQIENIFENSDFIYLLSQAPGDRAIASEQAQLAITAREIPGIGRVDMVGFPAHALEQYSEVLRDKYDLAIASTVEGGSHEVRRVLSIDHEAAAAIDAHEAEFGADGSRAFGPSVPLRVAAEEDLKAAVQAWNGDIASKRRVFRYMQEHGRERGTDQWLQEEYGGELDAFPVKLPGVEETTLPWRDVQRRMVRLIRREEFYTDQELDNFDDVDPAAIREHLAESGIVNGEVVDPEALNRNPFIQQVMADAEQIAQEEKEQLTDREYAEQYMIPGETFFEHAGRQYRIDSVIPETGTVYFQDIGPGQSVDGMDMYLDTITNVRKYMEYGDGPTFVTPGGTVFRAGDDFDARSAGDEIHVRIHLDSVDEESVYYSFPDGPEQEPVSMPRQDFDHYVDEGRFNRIEPEAQAVDNSLDLTLSDGSTYHVGDTVTIGGTEFNITDIGPFDVQLLDPKQSYPIFRAESHQSFEQLMMREKEQPKTHSEQVAFYPAVENGLPYDIEIHTLRFDEPEREPPTPTPPAENYHITDSHLGEGGPKEKFWRNIKAITTLKQIESENRPATLEEQHILSQYVGWGGLADAFDPDKPAWAAEYSDLKGLLTDDEYAAARSSTLNAHYTSPTVIKAMYDALANMGFQTGNILEPAMGVGNFFGMLPEQMRSSRLYGVELDNISGRIAKQLYPQANITVAGFETTDRKDFFDVAVGNVPFGQYQVNDRAYNKLGFSIHNYFFAKALDQVRPGGVVAFVTSRYTMDAKSPEVRRYLAQQADLLGAIRLPNNAFKANAGTDVVSDIIFLQKRETPQVEEPDWVHLAENSDGFAINSYFVDHPEMILGRQSSESTQYGRQDFTVEPIEALELSDQLEDAIKYIRGSYTEAELPDLGEGEVIRGTIPADPEVKNYSFTVVDGEVYYRENSVMVCPDLNATAKERVKGMVALRDCVHELIDLEMDELTPDWRIEEKQGELNRLYDTFSAKYGLINDRANRLAFADDSSYYLLCSLEVLDEEKKLERKADMFSKRTIKQDRSVSHVDTAVEALTVSIGEKACVDLGFMASLMGGSEKIPEIVEELHGIIFKDPSTGPFDLEEGGSHWDKGWQTADEYLSGNVRKKLREAKRAAEQNPAFQVNVAALEQAQPKDLDASEIEVRVGSTWIDKEIFQQFIPVQFYVSAEELEMIREKMAIVGTENLSAYLRKIAIDGQIIKLDLPELKEARTLLRHTSDNFNQLTKRVNATGRLYNEDLADMKSSLNQVWDVFNGILQRLARLS